LISTSQAKIPAAGDPATLNRIRIGGLTTIQEEEAITAPSLLTGPMIYFLHHLSCVAKLNLSRE
jgi:hypothetical protein